jgi:enoyl-CoA hydratase/carnithine racemase
MANDYRYLSIERANHVATVWIDKPPVNSLDESIYAELMRLADQVDSDPETRAVVFASRNPKMFIAGADIKEMATYTFTEEWILRKIGVVHAMFNRLEDITRPTIAAITGHALGGGCEFALACDFRFMSRGFPRIGLPEIRLGIIPGGGGTQRAPRVLGYAKALDLMLTGRHLDADEAEKFGLINRACDPERTVADAQEFAKQLAEQAPVAVAMIKRVLRLSFGLRREEGMAVEREHCKNAVLSEDAREGISAFLEKRKPRWSGK